MRAAYVFGCQIEGRADRWSDIDVAAFVVGAEKWSLWERAGIIADVQRETGFDIDAHLFSAVALEQSEPRSFAHWVITHGVRLEPNLQVA